jgi:hypothetical protein
VIIDVRRIGRVRFAFAALAAFLTLPSVAAAQDLTYFVDDYELSAEDVAKVGRADDSKNRGIAALGRQDWATAHRQCDAAIAGYNSAGVPNEGGAADVYLQARACAADAFARLGQMEEACRRYRRIGHHTLMTGSPSRMCAEHKAAEDATYQAWDDYAGIFEGFATSTVRLQRFGEGSPDRARGLAEVRSSCARLGAFSTRIEGASAGAGYCNAIVKFETGDYTGACGELARARSHLGTLNRSTLRPERSRHVQSLGATVEGFRSICAETPSAW